MEKLELKKILNECSINGNIVKLPDIQLERKLYQNVAKKIELIGGKWNRSAKGFVFKEDPTELFEAIKNGENKNLKKEYQFFETPQELAEKLTWCIPIGTRTVLEPSAGQGAIVRAINKKWEDVDVFHCELMELNRKQFRGKSTYIQDDFLTLPFEMKFDVVVANPPFAKNQDIEHFYKMMEHAEKAVISIMSNHWRTSKNKKESDFRAFLEGLGAEVIEIPAGTFKCSGTGVSACVVIVKK